MKKIFSLFAALLLTISMWGAQTKYTMVLNSTDASLVCDTVNGIATLTLDANASGTSYGYDVVLNLHPTSLDNLAGTYTVDGTPQVDDNSKIQGTRGTSANRYVVTKTGYTTSITIAKVENTDNTYTIIGQLQALISKTSGNIPYLYEFAEAAQFTIATVDTLDPYRAEPQEAITTTFTTPITSEMVNIQIDETNNTVIFMGYAEDYSSEIQFTYKAADATVAMAAGDYNISNTGANGTFLASSTTVDAYGCPLNTYYATYDAEYNSIPYFILEGTINIAYSQDNKNIIVTGAMTSAHGSTINLDITRANPWFVPEPDTIDLTVSSVSVSGKSNLTLSLKATPNDFVIGIVGTALDGVTIANIKYANTYASLDEYGYTYSDADEKAENSLSIVATGNTDEYKLNATITCKNKNTYVMKDVIFTYHIPTPWDAEVAREDFEMNLNWMDATNQIASEGWILCEFSDENWNMVKLEFPTDTFYIAPGTYTVTDDTTKGTILASGGKIGFNHVPSCVLLYENYNDVYFYIRSGEVEVSYVKDSIFMTGEVTTYRGTKVTLNLRGSNPWYVPVPAITDIAIAGDTLVGETLTFSATVEDFSAEPTITYYVKADGGEYEVATEGTFTPANAGKYTVKAEAVYEDQEASMEKSFIVKSATPTDLDNINATTGKASKWMRNGQIFILRGNRTFSLPGQKLK